MKCLSLWQPYATLLVRGVKIHETRHWPTRYRGPLAIHAAKRFDREYREWTHNWFMGGWFQDWPDFENPKLLPLGAIVGVVTLTDILPTQLVYGPDDGDDPKTPLDFFMGDYKPGRYAWRCENPLEIPPIPWKGMQGLFEIPDDLFELEASRG